MSKMSNNSIGVRDGEMTIANAKKLYDAAQEVNDVMRNYLEDMDELANLGANVNAIKPLLAELKKEANNLQEIAQGDLKKFIGYLATVSEIESGKIVVE